MMFNIIVTVLGVALAAATTTPIDHKSAIQMLDKEFQEMYNLINVAYGTLLKANSDLIMTRSIPRDPPNESDSSWERRERYDDANHRRLQIQFEQAKKDDLLKCGRDLGQELREIKDKAVAALSSAEPVDLGQRIESSQRDLHARTKKGIVDMMNIRFKIYEGSNVINYVKFEPQLSNSLLGYLFDPKQKFQQLCADVKSGALRKNFENFYRNVIALVKIIDWKFDNKFSYRDEPIRPKFHMFVSDANAIQYKKMLDVVLCTSPWQLNEGNMSEFNAKLGIYYSQHETKVREIANKLFRVFNDIVDASGSFGLMVTLQFTRALTVAEVKYSLIRIGKAKWYDERNKIIHVYDLPKLKSEDDIKDYLIQKLVDVLSWFNQEAEESKKQKVFATKLVDLILRQFKHNVKDTSLADWLSHPPGEWPAWYRFVEFAIWQASNDFLNNYVGDCSKPESKIQQIIFNNEFF